ncbi:hypothetical protein HY29_07715 [Hyphomonas beringensis]|uniref:Uncharacterized protein n=1 Tax=Hyphomonas beringensis TaxID=1280946 RepID=A0A062UH32_9PROT|nr:hypothetical protein [Hyphomonas beringensis]KCZ57023.1 hypothetical protein HY29_07715 [Hyphomonas beringensis]
MGGVEIFGVIGFVLASYAVVANDSIQTLGTFLSSNSKRPWWVLWLFASAILLVVLFYGYFHGHGDVAYDRLDKLSVLPGEGDRSGLLMPNIQWWHALPPLVLLLLTRWGIPVSTTFLVLTLFALSGGSASDGILEKMIIKSAMGYVVAFGCGIALWVVISRTFERWVYHTRDEMPWPYWVTFQWLTTTFLWSQWLMQDLANIFVYLPREVTVVNGETHVSFAFGYVIFGAILLIAIQAYIFATKGGQIQRIVERKINTVDVRAATIVDLIYGIILFIFKEVSNVPMSTTWVFLGLLAGRELAISYVAHLRDKNEAVKDVLGDAGRAFLGLIISIILAFAMPLLGTGKLPSF